MWAVAAWVAAAVNVGMYFWVGMWFSLLTAAFCTGAGIYAWSTGRKVAAFEREGDLL